MTSGAVSRAVRELAVIAVAVVAVSIGAGLASASKRAPAATTPNKTADSIVRQWRSNLRTSAAADPRKNFVNPAKQTLLARLQAARARYHFDVVSVRFLRPRQLAPLVIVKTRDEHGLAAATPAILRSIDPKARTGDDRTGWAYEGFLFEARNSNGVPFLVVFNNWRGAHAGGGQWAADASLYPFAHG